MHSVFRQFARTSEEGVGKKRRRGELFELLAAQGSSGAGEKMTEEEKGKEKVSYAVGDQTS